MGRIAEWVRTLAVTEAAVTKKDRRTGMGEREELETAKLQSEVENLRNQLQGAKGRGKRACRQVC